jgi:hypothetical protein
MKLLEILLKVRNFKGIFSQTINFVGVSGDEESSTLF